MATDPLTFAKEVRTELTKVVWPTREQALRLTVVVLAISIAVGLLAGGMDIMLTKTMETLLKR